MFLGQEGEKIAEAYLLTRGYRILERNWTAYNRGGKQIGELDIIAMRKRAFVFVEVKSSEQKDEAYRPEIRLTDRKLHKVSLAARVWLGKKGKLDAPWQIDSVAVDFSNDPPTIRHYCHTMSN